MPPRDNWYPNVTDQPGFYWAYCEMVDSNIMSVDQLYDESEVWVEDYGENGWSSDEEEGDTELWVVPQRVVIRPSDVYDDDSSSDGLSDMDWIVFDEESDIDHEIPGLTMENPIDLTNEN
jgi:hypothetical protein